MQALHALESRLLCNIRDKLDLCKIVFTMDRYMIPNQPYGHLFTLLSEAVQAVGHPSPETPMRPLSEVKALLSRENGEIVANHALHLVSAGSEECTGYMGEVLDTLDALIEGGGL